MSAFSPVVQDGVCLNGCLPITSKQRDRLEEVKASAVSIPDAVWAKDEQPPIVKWDSAFEKWLAMRTAEAKAYRAAGICSFPWEIIKYIPRQRKTSSRLFWNQGSLPSCSLHGATHGAQFTTLIEILHGAPIKYNAFNPIVPFYIARGGNLAGGLGLFDTAEAVNSGGQYPTALVGDDNLHVPDNYEQFTDLAVKYQVALCYLSDHLVERIIACCKADLFVTFGSGTIFTGSIERDGIKILQNRISGGHAQCFGCYRKHNGKEYVFDFNSHGERYGQSAEGEPAVGAWCDKDTLRIFCEDMLRYGDPYVNLSVETDLTGKIQFKTPFKVPFHKNFNRD